MWGLSDAKVARAIQGTTKGARRAGMGKQASNVTRMVRKPDMVGVA
jgi:hypothetical protein